MADDQSSIEEAAAAGHLALHLLETFFRHQVGTGAITTATAMRAWRQAAEFAAEAEPELAPHIHALARAATDRLDQDEAARFE
jgi:hypothetical protein